MSPTSYVEALTPLGVGPLGGFGLDKVVSMGPCDGISVFIRRDQNLLSLWCEAICNSQEPDHAHLQLPASRTSRVNFCFLSQPVCIL